MDAHSIEQRFIASSFAKMYNMLDYEIIPNGFIMYLVNKYDSGSSRTVRVLNDGTVYILGGGGLQVFPLEEGNSFFW
jgi:hypothetical protein